MERNSNSSTFAPAFERERRMRHDERGNLCKGDEVSDAKQNSNRHSDFGKTFQIFLQKYLAVKKKSLPLQPQSKRKRKFFERFTYQQVVQVL